ncbi:MAG TPA: hypothetical protein VJW76_11575 [Verrucomicrobiae bacterium]|nr:hypothetical protein [Verrucomicrobiae bacterium]
MTSSVFLLFVWPDLPAAAAESPVQAELVIPPGETHVIGDPIQLIWRFRNNSTEPLAFMWEGCCRLNGRLTVTAEGKSVALIPPGQALGHRFARAERLDPGKPRDFDTFLSDWVRLSESGTYQLQGRYVGVLPEQQPQVPRNLKLWRDTAATAPIEVSVLSVDDYLRQRETRTTQRKLSLQLAGPRVLPPLRPSPLQLTIRNQGNVEQKLIWPNDAQLWIVNTKGQRLGLGTIGTAIEGAYEENVLKPGAAITREIAFGSEKLEGEPFGDYRVFIDLQTADKPRVPSNAIEVRWGLSDSDVAELVRQAASGPRVGLRNPPLKLLRAYLGELRTSLEAISLDGAGTNVVALARQLRLAACLKPLGPKPGRVDFTIHIARAGSWRLAGTVEDCLAKAGTTAVDRVSSLLGVRRHLGWDVGLRVEPDDDATIERIMNVMTELRSFEDELATAPQAFPVASGTNDLGSIGFRQAPGPAHLIVRLSQGSSGTRYELARSTPAGQRAVIQPEDLRTTSFESLPDRAALQASLRDGVESSTQILMLAAREIVWREITNTVEPLLRRGISVDLCRLL